MNAPACPECAAGKHQNCDGDTWDPDADERTVCPCWDRLHQPVHIDRRTPEQIAADRAADQYEASLEGER